MKIMNKISLQGRVTLLATVILLACSVSITVFSMLSARETLFPLMEPAVSLYEPPLEDTDGEVASASLTIPAKQTFDVRSILICVVVTLAGAGASWYVSGKALNSVKELSERISEIDESNLSQRLPELDSKDEVGLLTNRFNHMLSRLEEAFIKQKRFTASAAHELKTPLATMKAGIQVLKRDNNATLNDYQENASMILSSIERLTGVVNDLLLIASTDESQDLAKEEIDLSVMLESVIDEIAPLFEETGVVCQLDCDEITVSGNPAMLYRVFLNLIENAYKYNRPGGSIRISAHSQGQDITVKVSDTGIGIQPEHLPSLCDAFYRADASRSRKIAGAGLGLSIVQTILHKHDGRLEIESEFGKGSAFTVVLPQIQ